MSGQEFTIGISGVTQSTWLDPARPSGTIGPLDPGAPSRLNPHVGRPHLRWIGVVGTQITISAQIAGSLPFDFSLGGRLFTAWAVEHPQPGPVVFTSTVGKSAQQKFTPTTEGHYSIAMARAAGGTVIVHIDVEVP